MLFVQVLQIQIQKLKEKSVTKLRIVAPPTGLFPLGCTYPSLLMSFFHSGCSSFSELSSWSVCPSTWPCVPCSRLRTTEEGPWVAQIKSHAHSRTHYLAQEDQALCMARPGRSLVVWFRETKTKTANVQHSPHGCSWVLVITVMLGKERYEIKQNKAQYKAWDS